MELDDQDMSPEEQRLVAQLEQLGVSPTPQRRLKIMAAVRAAQPASPSLIGRWRVALAAVGALAVLAASSVGAMASSGDALPNNPNYSLRVFGEQVRLALADPASRERLRISFARARIAQAQTVLKHGDKANAKGLLRDSNQYLDDARKDIGGLPRSEQGEVESEVDQAQASEHETESHVDQTEGD